MCIPSTAFSSRVTELGTSAFKKMSVMIIENVWPNASSFYLLLYVWTRPISMEPFLAYKR